MFLRLPHRSKNDRRLKQSVRRSQFLVTEVTAARLTTHRRVFAPDAKEYFWNWRDRRIIFLRPKCFCDCPTEAKVTVDWSKVSADRNFLWLRWPQHGKLPTEEFSRLARQITLRLAWPMNNFPPTEVFLRLPDRSKNDRRLKQSVRRSQFLVTEVTAARLTTHRRVFAPGATDYFATGVTDE